MVTATSATKKKNDLVRKAKEVVEKKEQRQQRTTRCTTNNPPSASGAVTVFISEPQVEFHDELKKGLDCAKNELKVMKQQLVGTKRKSREELEMVRAELENAKNTAASTVECCESKMATLETNFDRTLQESGEVKKKAILHRIGLAAKLMEERADHKKALTEMNAFNKRILDDNEKNTSHA